MFDVLESQRGLTPKFENNKIFISKKEPSHEYYPEIPKTVEFSTKLSTYPQSLTKKIAIVCVFLFSRRWRRVFFQVENLKFS